MGIVFRVAETEDQPVGDVEKLEAAKDLDGRKQGADLISSENIIDLFIAELALKLTCYRRVLVRFVSTSIPYFNLIILCHC